MTKRSPVEDPCPKCGMGIVGQHMKRHIDSRVCRERARIMGGYVKDENRTIAQKRLLDAARYITELSEQLDTAAIEKLDERLQDVLEPCEGTKNVERILGEMLACGLFGTTRDDVIFTCVSGYILEHQDKLKDFGVRLMLPAKVKI